MTLYYFRKFHPFQFISTPSPNPTHSTTHTHNLELETYNVYHVGFFTNKTNRLGFLQKSKSLRICWHVIFALKTNGFLLFSNQSVPPKIDLLRLLLRSITLWNCHYSPPPPRSSAAHIRNNGLLQIYMYPINREKTNGFKLFPTSVSERRRNEAAQILT